MNDKNMAAFPRTEYDGSVYEGMTLRDYFAAHVAAGFMSVKPMHFNPDDDAAYFYKIADAMIAARDK